MRIRLGFALASLMTFASSVCLWIQSIDALIRKFTAPDDLKNLHSDLRCVISKKLCLSLLPASD
jgi:hypothetical protein